ncbi:alpha carbonic anhydrase 1, chloroplastic [Rosa rugosa]|uniref:alpha carbonic anhydrase 1, chloroplastic n=1 Tax=Rosa rugosa TaxID=74645 RepID=UPI002B40CB48|nr:alpha carbonic anhydrase 1, chloroplastic [Rosa rugosa]
MAPRISVSILMVTLLLVGSSACFVEELKSLGFTYSGATGPQRWGSLSPYFSACNGKKQSPLDLAKDKVIRSRNFKPLTRNYLALNATLYNNGFNIGVHFDGQIAGTLVIDGKNYNLKQLHWHSPSEHRINGVQFPAELHLVHLADDNSIAVVANLFQYGKDDIFISQIKDKLAELAEEVCRRDKDAHIPLGNIDMKEFDKRTRKYWRYVGSLSSPPCTENVIWNILGKVRYISKAQIDAIKAPLGADYKNNSRPLQPLNGRKIELFHELSN